MTHGGCRQHAYRSSGARRFTASLLLASLCWYAAPAPALAYAFGYIVGDMRQPAAESGGTACPQPTRFGTATAGGINRQWSTSLSANPPSILTQDQTSAGQLNEIESVIAQSFGIWTGVAGTTLQPSSLAPLARTSTQAACDSSDSLNTICLNQSDPGFTTGVLAFTRVTVADISGEQLNANQPPSTFVGQILDADILISPSAGSIVFATPAALSANPQAYDFESVLAHELGHFFGLEHSDVWRAMMIPFVPPPGQFLGERPSLTAPDAPLADDDRTGLRALYPDPADTTHIGVITGRILPANPLSLAAQPGTTGIFAGQVVAIDNATGEVIATAQTGWSCSDPGPPVFDGSYGIERLPVGPTQSYQIYVEPFTGAEDPSDVANALAKLCRNTSTDPGWPANASCTVPAVSTNFAARIRPPN
jgi:hypothetical protein